MAAQQWWVIAFTSYGTPPSYEYFQGTKAQAEAKAKLAVEVSTSPAITGPFPTKAAAEASVKAGKANTPSPGDSGPHVGNPLKGLAAIGDFFARLTEANTWLRIGEGLLGVILVAIGIARLTHAVPVATRIAEAVK